MNVETLVQTLSLHVYTMPEPERMVSGGYVGDLLSWVMGRATENCAWITIMSNQNVAAVAVMVDISCVILTEGVKPDETLLKQASERGVNLLGSSKTTFEMASQLGALLA